MRVGKITLKNLVIIIIIIIKNKQTNKKTISVDWELSSGRESGQSQKRARQGRYIRGHGEGRVGHIGCREG